MGIKFTPKTILYFLALLWIVFSLIYISWGIWQNYRNVQLARAYDRGVADVIHQLIQEADKCQPFSVHSEEKEIELIKTDCPELTQ